MTLRVGERLVGVRPDTDATAELLGRTFGPWLDPAATGEHGEPIPWAFSLRLDTARTGRGPRAVPQLRIGGRLLARSRQADDMVIALDQVLGGVLARQDESRHWLGLRTFVAGDRAVLVDAAPPVLTADPSLARADVNELPSWVVAVDGDTVHVPPPLTATADGPGAETSFALAGLVGLDDCGHTAETDDADAAEHQAVHHPTTPGVLLARFAARHPSNEWFHTVETLVADGRVHVGTDRPVAAEQIRRLVTADPTSDSSADPSS